MFHNPANKLNFFVKHVEHQEKEIYMAWKYVYWWSLSQECEIFVVIQY